MRKKIVAGNWKMNKDYDESKNLVTKLLNSCKPGKAEVIIAPPFTNLLSSIKILEDSSIKVAAQNMHYADSGAYTGEISAGMLQDIGVQHVILGHSERRGYFSESDDLLKDKVQAALQAGLQVVFCFGEELEERKSGTHFEVVKKQLSTALFDLDALQWKHIVLAYEPVWAIGTGETASAEQAQEMHAFIRSLIRDHYDNSCADGVSILYGGSVKPANAAEIFAQVDVDGGLIGGASLQAKDFAAIVNGF